MAPANSKSATGLDGLRPHIRPRRSPSTADGGLLVGRPITELGELVRIARAMPEWRHSGRHAGLGSHERACPTSIPCPRSRQLRSASWHGRWLPALNVRVLRLEGADISDTTRAVAELQQHPHLATQLRQAEGIATVAN